MKSYLRTKQPLQININTIIYTNLILILTSLLFISIVPLFWQPMPLHALAKSKTTQVTTVPIIITIHQHGEYQLNTEMQTEQSMPLDTLKATLNKQFKILDPQQTSICIKSDPTIPYGHVIDIIDWLHSIGARHIGLLTTNTEPTKTP